MVRMSATEVSRNFSAVINRVGSGEEIEIVRNGRAIAELRPPSPPVGLTDEAFKALVASLPPVDDAFAGDVERARRRIGPPAGKWPAS